MSLVKTLKEKEEQVAALVAEKETIATANAAAVAALQGKIGELESAAIKASEEFTAKLTEANNKINALTTEVEQRDNTIKDLAAGLEVLKGERDAEKARAEAAEARMKNNPAFADAAAGKSQEPIADAEAHDGKTQTPTWDAYNKISSPVERTKFWNANKEKLLAEQKLNVAK